MQTQNDSLCGDNGKPKGGHRSVTPLLRYSVTNKVTFLSNDVTDRYFLFMVMDREMFSYFFGLLLRYFFGLLLRYSITPILHS